MYFQNENLSIIQTHVSIFNAVLQFFFEIFPIRRTKLHFLLIFEDTSQNQLKYTPQTSEDHKNCKNPELKTSETPETNENPSKSRDLSLFQT